MHREPAATWFGIGQVSSSDGQHFYLGGEGETGGPEDAHYGRDPIIKLYTHISDRYAPFHVKVITGTSGEAIHVLDGLVNHDITIDILAHHTDGGGLRLWLRERFQAARRADAATEVISGALSGRRALWGDQLLAHLFGQSPTWRSRNLGETGMPPLLIPPDRRRGRKGAVCASLGGK